MKKLTESNARNYTLFLVTLTFVLRLYIAAYTGLGIGESYYFRGALRFDLSYFDQPPLFFWLGGLSIKLFGLTTLGLRFPSVLLFAGTCWLLFLVTRSLFNAKAGFWAVLLINLSAVFTIPIACWFQPDAPLMFFWMLSTYLLVQLLIVNKSVTGQNPHSGRVYALWILTGISMGLDILSKYHVLFLFVGVFLFVATNKRQRHWLSHPGPYVAIFISLLIAFPVIWWNYQNNWVSFVFQGSRASGHDFKLHVDWLLRSIAGQAVWLLPWIWVPLISQLVLAFKFRNKDENYSFCFWTAVLPIVFFTLVTLWSDLQYHFHWQAPGYMMLFMPLGFSIDKKLSNITLTSPKRTKRWLAFTTCFSVITISVLIIHMVTGFWQPYGPKYLVGLAGEKTDPTVQGIDYEDIRERFKQEGWLTNKRIFTGSMRWWLTGKIDWALKGQKPIVVFDADPRNLAFLVNPKALIGCDAVIIGQDHQDIVANNLAPFFDKVEQKPDVVVKRNGVDELHLQVYYCKNFRLCKQAKYDFPLYRQLLGRPPF